MLGRPRQDDWKKDHGPGVVVLVALLEGPKGMAELREYLAAFPLRLGIFPGREPHVEDRFGQELDQSIALLVERGWVESRAERYRLTDKGRVEAESVRAKSGELVARVKQLVEPATAARVTLVVHLVLAAVKLPAAVLSGSVGLLNDAVDTLLDGLSSLLVFFGIRLRKERAANVVLVLFMLATGGFATYEAARRFFVPTSPDADLFAFVAVVVSALVCGGLWAYQRYVGLRAGSQALITQSVDSRNHVLVAVGVTAGLVAAVLDFRWLDAAVGLAVAVLILKSGVELAVAVLRTMRSGEQADLSKYRVGLLSDSLDRFRRDRLKDWMLLTVSREDGMERSELTRRALQSLDFSEHGMLNELGLSRFPQARELVERAMAELLDSRLLVAADGRLRMTEAGRQRLARRSRRPGRQFVHWVAHRPGRARGPVGGTGGRGGTDEGGAS